MSRILLNLGTGARKLSGFLNVGPDAGADLQWDVTQGLPFPDGSVGGIACDHVLELLPRPQAAALLREMRRVLSPDGALRVATPDLDAALALPAERAGLEEAGLGWVRTRAELLNASLREGGRRWIYDEEDLTALARAAGLVSLGRRAGADSEIPELAVLEGREGTLVLELAPRSRFVGEEVLPLVSILIPGYRRTYLRECLESALGQTYPNIEVVLSDDCPTDDVREAMEPYLSDPRVRYRRNPVRDGIGNHLGALSLANGELIKFLNDDDVLLPRCVERMVEVLRERPEVTLVTSHRQQVDARGAYLPDIAATQRIVPQDAVIPGENVAEVLLASKLNFIGEPTTPMFRHADVEHLRPHPFSMAGVEVRFECDVALWSSLLGQGDFVYLPETLSLFRRHGEQAQLQPENLRLGDSERPGMLKHALRMGYFTRGKPKPLAPRPLREAEACACDPDVFHPAAPALELGGGREVRLLCVPDWRDAGWAEALLPFLRAFSAADPVSLVVRVEPAMPGPVHATVAALQGAMDAVGIAGGEAPDIVVEASEIPAPARGGLYTAVSALLPLPGREAERVEREARACGLPVVAAATSEAVTGEVARLLESTAAAIAPAPAPLS